MELTDVVNNYTNFGIYKPEENPILYHYCDLNTFLAIIQTKTIRLSDINTMNDFSEMHWGYDKFIEAVNAEFEKYEKEFFDELDKFFSGSQLIMHPAIACFSSDGDVLSQWRAYADDGKGVAIGFDGNKIKDLATKIGKVIYDSNEQLEFFKSLFQLTYPGWMAAQKDSSLLSEFQNFVVICSSDLCLLKNPAFSEEKEIRLVRMLAPSFEDGNWSLLDEGGVSKDGISQDPHEIKFRSRDGGIVAYLDMSISGLGSDLIKEVVLGPKTKNNGIEVSMALSANGFKDAEIKSSRATYR